MPDDADALAREFEERCRRAGDELRARTDATGRARAKPRTGPLASSRYHLTLGLARQVGWLVAPTRGEPARFSWDETHALNARVALEYGGLGRVAHRRHILCAHELTAADVEGVAPGHERGHVGHEAA